MKRTNCWRTGVAVGVVLCAGLALGTMSPLGVSGAAAQPEREPLVVDSAQLQDDLHQARSLSRAFQHAASLVEDSVVHITTKSSRVASDFFGRRVRQQASGLGSGVVVSEDGYILTNNHVIEDATELMVRFAGGREYEATLVGGDALRDIAVLKVDATGLQPARFGSSESMEVGEWVLAIGSPFGFDRTVTAGIISAKGRGLGIVSDEFKDAEQFIQTDAAINPGNSGGALVDMKGRLVGINTAIFSRSGGSNGIGFAIPSNLAHFVAMAAEGDGIIRRPWLGAGVQAVSADIAEAMGLDRPRGVLVTSIAEDSPADRAGLKVGDLITRVGEANVADPDGFGYRFATRPIGGSTSFTV
ncbi:MAG: S1C family serine protease, partial [Phycisphaerales bacterium JB054]